MKLICALQTDIEKEKTEFSLYIVSFIGKVVLLISLLIVQTVISINFIVLFLFRLDYSVLVINNHKAQNGDCDGLVILLIKILNCILWSHILQYGIVWYFMELYGTVLYQTLALTFLLSCWLYSAWVRVPGTLPFKYLLPWKNRSLTFPKYS